MPLRPPHEASTGSALTTGRGTNQPILRDEEGQPETSTATNQYGAETAFSLASQRTRASCSVSYKPMASIAASHEEQQHLVPKPPGEDVHNRSNSNDKPNPLIKCHLYHENYRSDHRATYSEWNLGAPRNPTSKTRKTYDRAGWDNIGKRFGIR